ESGGDLRAAAVQVYVVGQPGRRVQVGPPSGGRVVVHHPEVVAAGAGRIYRDGEFVAAVAVEVTGHREPGGDLRTAAVQVRVVGQPGVRVEMRPTGGRQLQRQPWIAGTERELCRRQRRLVVGEQRDPLPQRDPWAHPGHAVQPVLDREVPVEVLREAAVLTGREHRLPRLADVRR